MDRPDDPARRSAPNDLRTASLPSDSHQEPDGWPVYPPTEPTLPAQADPPRTAATPGPARRRVTGKVVAGVVAGVAVLGLGVAVARGNQTWTVPPAAGVGAGWVYADPALVTGIVSVNAGSRGLATGIVVSADGTVVAPYDAVLGADSLTVTLPDGNRASQVPAELAGFDVTRNLAVLRVPELAPAAMARFAAHPAFYGQPATVVSQSGVEYPAQIATKISGTEGSWQVAVQAVGGPELATVPGLLTISLDWTDAGGGGVVLDPDGGVVGLVIQTFAMEDRPRPETRLYAVPIDDVRAVVADVDAGLDTDTVRVGPAGDLGLDYAVDYAAGQVIAVVGAVAPEGPAAKAGIAKGDILVKIGDTRVRDTKGAAIGLEGMIRMLEPGTEVAVTWQPGSGGQPRTATLTVGRADS